MRARLGAVGDLATGRGEWEERGHSAAGLRGLPMGPSSALELRKYLNTHSGDTHMHPYLCTHELAPSYPDLPCVDRKAQDPARLHENHVPVTAHMDKCAHSHAHVNTCTYMYTEHSLAPQTWSLPYECVSVYVHTHIHTCLMCVHNIPVS